MRSVSRKSHNSHFSLDVSNMGAKPFDWMDFRIGITPLSGTTSESHMKHDVTIANEFKGFQEDETRALLRLIK